MKLKECDLEKVFSSAWAATGNIHRQFVLKNFSFHFWKLGRPIFKETEELVSDAVLLPK